MNAIQNSISLGDTSAVLATSRGFLNCRDHTFSVAIPFSDL